MAGDTAVLSLDGNIDLATFSAALQSFRMLLDGLSETFAAGYRIDWEITGLRACSALTAVRAVDVIQDKVSTGKLVKVDNIAVHQRSLLAISTVRRPSMTIGCGGQRKLSAQINPRTLFGGNPFHLHRGCEHSNHLWLWRKIFLNCQRLTVSSGQGCARMSSSVHALRTLRTTLA
jgi:hypothetical protein